MKAHLLVTNIGQLVTCAPGTKPKRGADLRDVGIVENAALAISDGRFVGVGSRQRIEMEFASDQVIDARGRAVIPGLVDSHTHIVFAGNRLDEFELKIQGGDYLDILRAGGGILSTVKKTRDASEADLFASAWHRLDKMLRCGTTTAEIKTGYGLDAESELKMLRVIERLDREHPVDIVPTLLAAHAIPMEFKDHPDEYVKVVCEEIVPRALNWYKGSHFFEDGRPFFCDVFCEQGAFSLAQSRRVLEAATRAGFKLKAHAEQFSDHGASKMVVDMGATSVDHLDVISEDSISALARSDTIGTVIPTENFSGGKVQYADARKLVDRGCAVALTTDYNPGSAPSPSLLMAMAIASRYQKLLPSECMNAVTVNAAFAIGISERIGSIEVGKSADLVLLDCDDYRMAAYEFGGNLVKAVIKSGKQLNSC